MQKKLVVMTNGDVYYVTRDMAEHLQDAIQKGIYKIAIVEDTKSKSRVTLVLRNVSSIVEEADRG